MCLAVCNRDFENDMRKCPCQSGCPNGCPCDEYVCPITTTSATTTTTATVLSTTTSTTATTTTSASPKTEVLILNTWSSDNIPVITNESGRVDRDFFFMMGDNTEVRYSCGLTWRNQNYVFGGSNQVTETQISQIIDCQLKKIGQLAFYHYYGACANVADNGIYLCFNNDSKDRKKCRVANSPTGRYEETAESIYAHSTIRIAASDRK